MCIWLVACVVYWRCLNGVVVRLISVQYTIEGFQVVEDKIYPQQPNTLDGSMFYCLGKEAVFVVVVGGGYFFCICVGGWILFGCVRASGIGIDV